MRIVKPKAERERNKLLKEARKNINPQTYDASKHRSWGNSIQILLFDQKTGAARCTGWLHRKPVAGDYLVVPSADEGVSRRFTIFGVEHVRDPRDMFFAELQFVDYVNTADVKENLHHNKRDWIF